MYWNIFCGLQVSMVFPLQFIGENDKNSLNGYITGLFKIFCQSVSVLHYLTYKIHSHKIPMTQQGKHCYLSILSNQVVRSVCWCLPRISNGTNSPRLALSEFAESVFYHSLTKPTCHNINTNLSSLTLCNKIHCNFHDCVFWLEHISLM